MSNTTRARAALEYRQHADVYAALGVTEAEFIQSYLISSGEAALIPNTLLAKPLRFEHLPGIVSTSPGPHEVGSPE